MLKVYLVIEKGLAAERIYHLQSLLTIGRAPDSDIHPSDPAVSRFHALAYVEDEKTIFQDARSLNGTYVNEERVNKAVLSQNDTVRIGNQYRQIVEIIKVNHFCSCSKR